MKSRLRVLLAEREMTQSDLIERANLGSHTVSKLYNNTFKRVDTDTVERLCDFFQCDISDLFVLKDEEASQ